MVRGLCAAVAVLMLAVPAQAQTIPVKIGVLTDMGGFFSDATGQGSVIAVELAIEDAKKLYPELEVSVVGADHQNKPDVGSAVARQWFDQDHVDTIIDLTNSAVGLAVQQLGKERGKVTMSTAGTSVLTETACSPTGVQWAMDSYTYSKAVTQSILKGGGTSWFFLVVDFAGGYSLEKGMGDFVQAAGGKIAGAVRHPSGTRDFAPFLLQAKASGAQVIGLANAGQDTIEAIKQAHEFGLTQAGVIMAAPVFFITNAHALGLETAQGVRFGSPFYWDMNDEARAWSKRFFARVQKMPTHVQAGDYTFAMHYLAAVHAAKSTAAPAVMAAMRAAPVEDFMTKGGQLRANGSVVRQRLLLEVKRPADSHYAWDYARVAAVMDAAEAAPKPLAETGCPLQ